MIARTFHLSLVALADALPAREKMNYSLAQAQMCQLLERDLHLLTLIVSRPAGAFN
jgi:hypothetical protein